jgi:hypothetical protein
MRYKRGEYNTTAHEQNKDKTWHIKLITADCWLVLPPNNVLTDSFVPLASYTALLGCNIFSNNLTKSFYFPRAVPCLGYNCVWSMKLASYDYSHWSWPDPLKPFILNWSLKTRSTLLHQLVLLKKNCFNLNCQKIQFRRFRGALLYIRVDLVSPVLAVHTGMVATHPSWRIHVYWAAR